MKHGIYLILLYLIWRTNKFHTLVDPIIEEAVTQHHFLIAFY